MIGKPGGKPGLKMNFLFPLEENTSGDDNFLVDISDQPDRIYFIRVNKGKNIFIQKMVLQKWKNAGRS
jgi:hypothetical protein